MKKNIASLYFCVSYFRTGEEFLKKARNKINERRLVRATEESRFIPAKKEGVWSGRRDGMKMDEIKRRST